MKTSNCFALTFTLLAAITSTLIFLVGCASEPVGGVASTLPFSRAIPPLTAFNPTYVVVKPGQPEVLVQISGNFPQSIDDNLKPHLEAGTNKVMTQGLTSQSASFSLPTSALSTSENSIK